MSNADLVADFHDAVDAPGPTCPTVPERQTLELREALLREEFAEVMEQMAVLREAMTRNAELEPAELAGLAHELADLLYVTYGSFVALGIPADEVFAEVHRANLAKTAGPRRADGKQLKPPGWQPADVRSVLQRHQQHG